MANSMRKILACCLFAGVITGCASVKVVKAPADGDTGVRYYRPKPYLLVTPAEPTGRMVNMKLEYLPDFSEEYSAHVRGKASVALKDGWNLVGVNTKEAPPSKDEPPAKIEDIKLPPAVVAATNVPIGYYESVIGFNGNKKFLQGWRYIGMTTLGGGTPNICRISEHAAGCPTGGTPTPGCINGPLYGLVFFNGVMTFRQLDEIANNQLCPMYVNPTATAPMAGPEAIPPGGGNTIPKPAMGGGDTVPAPPTPNPNPGSASLKRPSASASLANLAPVARPSAVTTPARPKVTPVLAGPVPAAKPAAVAAKPAAKVVVTKAPAQAPATPSWDGSLPSLDQNLFKTTTSPRN